MEGCSWALVANQCKVYRHLSTQGLCSLSDRKTESTFHALVMCTHAKIIWDAMRSVWPLPGKHYLIIGRSGYYMSSPGSLWKQGIGSSCLYDVYGVYARILSMASRYHPWSRMWIILTVTSNLYILPGARYTTEEILKGKMPLEVDVTPISHVMPVVQPLPWPSPPTGWVALSVDRSFLPLGKAAQRLV